MGVPKYLGWLVLASVETTGRWNVMGAWPPSHMQSLIFARICLHGELGMWPLNLLTKVMYLTLESLEEKSEAIPLVIKILRCENSDLGCE